MNNRWKEKTDNMERDDMERDDEEELRREEKEEKEEQGSMLKRCSRQHGRMNSKRGSKTIGDDDKCDEKA